MLADGIYASVLFPTLPLFSGTLFLSFADKELADLCVKAYNDFVLDEWCPAGPPGLFVPTIIAQLWDPELAAAETRRNADKGAKALSFPENTVPLGLPSYWTDHWDPSGGRARRPTRCCASTSGPAAGSRIPRPATRPTSSGTRCCKRARWRAR